MQMAAPLAVGRAAIDTMTRGMRAEVVRSNMMWLLSLIRTMFSGNAMRALSGCLDRESVQLRQIAIYLAHVSLRLRREECASAFGLNKAQATRAFQQVEAQRADPGFNAKIAELETIIAQHMRREAA